MFEALTADLLCRRHESFMGEEPTDDQKSLYASFPDIRGYSDPELNEERFAAVVVLALSMTRPGTAGSPMPERVLLLAPAAKEKWVFSQLNKVADHIFAHCKSLDWDREQKIQLARAYGDMFKRLFIYGKLLRMEEEPPCWAIFGFKKEDPVPGWVPGRLLSK